MPGQEFPEKWPNGMTVLCRSYLFGIIPLGTRTLLFERIDHASYTIQTRECDHLVRRWDHLIRVESIAPGRCRYSDEIEIEAGGFTPVVWLFALTLYRHRQNRWRAIARRLQSNRPRAGG
ncbi:hypothetical protein FRUB_00589 [Fimbriiglobus ruber]|uniref:Uncharacterized protein n=1 Tax=Fimbriiglobus ruber TaxID=1908690 RepID=A0A225DZF2_9BACT|nr:hypothetical protein FRUB_00589 [Fimbriiglobus ruber]